MPLTELDGGANGVAPRPKPSPRKDAPFTFSQGVPIVEANLEPAMASKLSSRAYKPAGSDEVPYLKILEAKVRAGRPQVVTEAAVDDDEEVEPDLAPTGGVFAAVSAASSNGSSMGEEADGVISDSEALVAREALLASP